MSTIPPENLNEMMFDDEPDIPEPIDVEMESGGKEKLIPIHPDYLDKNEEASIVSFVCSKSKKYKDNLCELHRLFAKCEQAFLGVGFSPIMEGLPRISVPLIQRHCTVVASKIEQAVMNSGTLLQYIPKDPVNVDEARRVTSFMDKVVKNNGSNIRHLRHWIAAAPKFGTSFLKVSIENSNIPKALDEDSNHAIMDEGKLEVRWTYISPENIYINHKIPTIQDQPYIFEVEYISKEDILYKISTGEWDEDKGMEAINTSNNYGKNRYEQDDIGYNHPYYDTNDGYCKGDYKVVYCWQSDGWVFTVVNDTTLVEAKKTIHSRENGGAPYIPFYYTMDAGNFYGIPLPWQILSSQKELNDSKALALWSKVSALYSTTFVNIENLVNPNDIDNIRPGKYIEVNGDPRQIAENLMVPTGNYQAAQTDIMRIFQESEYFDGVSDNVTGAVTGGRTPTGTERIRSANAHSGINAIVNANVDNIIRLGEISLLLQRDIIEYQGTEQYIYDVSSDDYYYITKDDFAISFGVASGIDMNRVEPETAVANLQAFLGSVVQSMQMGAKFNKDSVEKIIRYMGELMNIPVEYLIGKKDIYKETLGELDKMAKTGIVANVNPESDHYTHILVELPVLNQAIDPRFRVALQEHIGRHAWELQKEALENKQIPAPIYVTEDMAIDDIAEGGKTQIEMALGLDFAPPLSNTLQRSMGIPPEQIPQGLQGTSPIPAGNMPPMPQMPPQGPQMPMMGM